MGKHIDQAARDALIADVKNGVRVADAAKNHGIHARTAYAVLRRSADNTGTSAIEVAKLRRENAELKETIGMFALEKKRAEKNRGGA